VREKIAAARVFPYREMRVWDASNVVESPETLYFKAAEFGLPELGAIVENELVQFSLLQRLRELGVEVRFETRVSALQWSTGPTVITVEGGEELTADLVVGADGANSRIRKSASIAVSSWNYPQHALVTHVRCSKPHQDIAWQRFLQNGPIALLPLSENRVSVVWSTTPDRAEAALAASDVELSKILTRISDGVLGELTADSPRGRFPLRAQIAKEYVRYGLALVGDAAHCVHPLAGQGVNLGFADVAELADVVATALENGEHPADLPVLRRYARARRGANATMLYFIDGLNKLFLSKAPALTRIRATGMRLFNESGPIKRRAVRTALGIDGL
jgi:ubiquinone biosynthesis UbiH/UbiF/VisC/COQ6 family hydroxylase